MAFGVAAPRLSAADKEQMTRGPTERWVALGGVRRRAVTRLRATHGEQRNIKGTHEAGVWGLTSSSPDMHFKATAEGPVTSKEGRFQYPDLASHYTSCTPRSAGTLPELPLPATRRDGGNGNCKFIGYFVALKSRLLLEFDFIIAEPFVPCHSAPSGEAHVALLFWLNYRPARESLAVVERRSRTAE